MSILSGDIRDQSRMLSKIAPKFGAIFNNIRLWSQISPERIDISKIGKVLDQLHFMPYLDIFAIPNFVGGTPCKN